MAENTPRYFDAPRRSFQGVDEDSLVTGEAVALELPPARFGVRLISGAIDLAAGAVLLVGGILLAIGLGTDKALLATFGLLAFVGAALIYPTAFETITRGKSLGKYAMGLRTVREDGGPISFDHAYMRALVGVVEIWVTSAVPALVCSLVNSKGKRLGDLVAGTYVVRERVGYHPPHPVPMPPPLAAWAASADIAPLPQSLAIGMRQLIGRLGGLSPDARAQLLATTAARVAQFVAPPPPPGTPPEAFLAAVQAERRRRDQFRLGRQAELRDRLNRRL